jgi:stage V sporulation protein T
VCYNKYTKRRKELIKMKATGIVRRIDELGRIVVPKDIRRTVGMREGDPVEIYIGESGELILKSYQSEASDKLKAVAESLKLIGQTPEHWKIAKEIETLANKLAKLDEGESL